MTENLENTTDTTNTTSENVVAPKRKSSKKTLIIVLVVIFLVFVLPGILVMIFMNWVSRPQNVANLTKNIAEDAISSEIESFTKDRSFTIDTGLGTFSAGTSKEIPDDLPESVALYTNQEVTRVFTGSKDSRAYWNIRAQSGDSIEMIDEAITEGFTDKGWDKVSTSSSDTSSSYSFTLNGLEAKVSISKDSENKSDINYLITQKSQ